MFHRVNERDLVIEDEIGVVAGTALGVVAMKTAHGPVDRSDPVNIVTNFDSVHEMLLSTIESYIQLIVSIYK